MAVEIEVGGSATIRVAGLTATRYRAVDADTGSSVAIGPVTTGITNTGTQRYKATLSVPVSVTAGDYEIQWDDGSGAWAATEDLVVTGGNTTVITDVILKFPVGTTVSAYRPYQANPSGGAPSGSAVTSAVVASTGSLTFTNLTDGADYIAAAQVNGTWQYLRFTG